MTRAREGLVLGYAERSVGGALQHPSPFLEEARAALDAPWEERAEELFGPDETLHATFTTLRDELLRSIPRTGGRLGELRLDTDLDVAHGAVRYLELVKLAALIDRPEGQSVADALPGINTALLGAATAQQREILQTSSLDEMLLGAERDARGRAAAIAAREEPSLEPFLPTRGDGLLLSASDIEAYRTCPLKYKFARVFRIPASRRSTSASGSSSTRCSSAITRAAGARSTRCSGCSPSAGGAAGSAPPTRSASCTPRPTARCAATTSASARRTASRCGSRRPSASAWARTPCAGAWTASTACPTATTS